MVILTPVVTFITSWLLLLFLLALYFITHSTHFFLAIQLLYGLIVSVKGQQSEKSTQAKVRFYSSIYQLRSKASIWKSCYPHNRSPFNVTFIRHHSNNYTPKML